MVLKFFRLLVVLTAGLALAGMASAKTHVNKANATHHTIKTAGRPFKALGHAVKTAAVGVGTFSFDAFDTAVVDPFGVALQLFADGVDMAIAAPLEALPPPIRQIGDGVHYVYLGLDWLGTQLAK